MSPAPLLILLLTLIPFGDARPRPEAAPDPEELAEEARPEAMPRLYDELAAAPNPDAAAAVAAQIESLWESSGSATADLLSDRAGLALAAGDLDMAERHLDDALRFAPNYADGWVRRAQLYTRREEHSDAFAALQRALTADPRHYRALVALARTLESMDSPQGAYEAYGEALAVYPHLERAQEERRRLAPLVEGLDL